ncbi:MAG: M15 family metallopeptidase [Mycobacteriales bacterium]
MSVITAQIRARMYTSWRSGCPVPLADLRYLRVSYWGFDAAVHRGELIVNAGAVDPVTKAMRSLFDARFPLAAMRLVNSRGGGGSAAVASQDTAAFNCRSATGRPGVWSQHSYGWAIDVNPGQNPYVGADGSVEPPASRPYVDRSRHAAGMIYAGDAVVRAFAAVGWSWGGDWTSVKDYQHFSATGR